MNYIVCGNYGAGNIGDEAILQGILQDISVVSPGANVTIFSGNPTETASQYQNIHGLTIEAVSFIPAGPRSFIQFFIKKQYKHTWGALKKANLFILGGGGLFTNAHSKRAPWIWFKQALGARFFGVKSVIYANSVGPLTGILARFLSKQTFKWASAITVRDAGSQKAIQDLGVKKEIHVTADPALGLKIPTHKSPKSAPKKYAVVSLRYLERTNKLYEQVVVEFIKSLISQNQYSIYLKPFGGGKITDINYLNKLIDQNNLDKNYVQVHENNSFEDTLTLIEQSDFLLGMRLHSLIFATLTRTPFIGLNYSAKVKSFARSINMEDFILELDDLSQESLQAKYTDIQKHSSHIQDQLETQLQLKRELLKKNRELLKV